MYASGQIGTKKVKELCGWPEITSLPGRAQYIRYKAARGILSIANRIDSVHAKGRRVLDGEIICTVSFAGGKVRHLRFVGEDTEYKEATS
jgi:hypothetical protein